MKLTTLLFSLAGLPLISGAALAATPLSDTQMDGMTAGTVGGVSVPPLFCANCTLSSSSSASQNGVTTKMGGSGTGPGVFFLTTPLLMNGIATVGPIMIITVP